MRVHHNAVFLLGFFALACGTKPAPDVAASPDADVIDATAYSVAALDEKPTLIKCSPRVARRGGATRLEGDRGTSVLLSFVVGEDGLVEPQSIVVRPSAPYRGMKQGWQASPAEQDAAAEDARHQAMTCQYEPGRIDGQAVRTVVTRSFRVTL